MGRKGVSKRKPSQSKSKPLSSGSAGGTVSSVMQATENQSIKSTGPGTDTPFARDGMKSSSDWKKKNKKG